MAIRLFQYPNPVSGFLRKHLLVETCVGSRAKMPRDTAVGGSPGAGANERQHWRSLFLIELRGHLVFQSINRDYRDHPVLLRNATSSNAGVAQSAKGYEIRGADDVGSH